MIGYMECSCRDCFLGPIIGNPGDMCSGCEEAGCTPWPGEGPKLGGCDNPNLGEQPTLYTCRNPHAYGGVDGTGHCGDVSCCGPLTAARL